MADAEDDEKKQKSAKTQCDDSCEIFNAAKNKYEFSFSVLQHLETYSHRHMKVPCRYGENCKAYVRCVNNEYRVDDRCHLHVYQHPPRDRDETQKLPKEWAKFDTLYANDKKQHFDEHRESRESLQLKSTDRKVEQEVMDNGFGGCLTTPKGRKLSEVVHDKLKHQRNKALPQPLCYDEMLAVILYTGCDCYSDLRRTERSGNYKKWKYFGASLRSAVLKLQHDKYAEKPEVLYSGMQGVGFLPKDKGDMYENAHHADTFTSFSWDESVARRFASNNGVIIKFLFSPGWRRADDKNFGMADVSWISKFPDECEYLMCRGFAFLPCGSKPSEYIKWEKTADGRRIQMVTMWPVIDLLNAVAYSTSSRHLHSK